MQFQYIQFTTNVIVYLMVACLLQVGGGRSAPSDDATGDSALSKVNSAVQDSANGAVDGLSAVFQNTGSAIMDFGSQTSLSLEELLKVAIRIKLATGNLLVQAFNGVSSLADTGTSYLATGIAGVDSYTKDYPILGVITHGTSNYANELSGVLSSASAIGRESRQKMYQNLLKQLDESFTVTTGAAASTADAAAPTADAAATTTGGTATDATAATS